MLRKTSGVRDKGAQRPVTTCGALIPAQPRNTEQRRIFSGNEPRKNRTNVEALEDAANRMDEPAAYLHDDIRMHRPVSTPRFGPLRIASREGFDIRITEGRQENSSQEDSHAENSEIRLFDDESETDGKSRSSPAQNSTQGGRSYSQLQEMIDSLWHVPEKLQEGFDDMKEEIDTRATRLSAEQRTSARLSRDVAEVERELNSFRAKEKEREDLLRAEKAKSDSLRAELETLKSESRRNKQIFEKSQTNKNKELEKVSQELNAAKKNLQLRDEEVACIQGDVACLKQETENEKSLKEGALAEAEALKRNLFELRRRSNEEKRQLLVAEEKREESLTKIGEQNQALTLKVVALEEAIEDQRELKEVVEADLLDVLSFLRMICNIVQRAYLAACSQCRGGLQEIIASSSSISLNIDEESREYEALGQLSTALNESLSAESALDLATSYQEALPHFFRTLILREIAHSQYVRFTNDDLQNVKAIHKQTRQHIQRERKRVRDWSVDLSSDILLQREQASIVKAAVTRKCKETKEELTKMEEMFRGFDRSNCAAMTAVTSCRRHLNFVKDELVKTKIWQYDVCEDFKELHSKAVLEKGTLYGELEKARAAIKDRDHAASVSAKKRKEEEAELRDEIAGLKTLVSQRDATLKQMSTSEVRLLKTKKELESRCGLAVTDCEENKTRMAALNCQIEKLVKENDVAFMGLAEAKAANDKMSEKLVEALRDKQKTLEALVVEKNANQDLRLNLAKASTTNKEQGIEHLSLQTLIQDELSQGTLALRKSRGTTIGERKSGVNENSHKHRDEKLQPSLAMIHDSPLLQTRDNVEVDLCEVDLAPTRPKRRTSVQQTRKSPRQKRARSSTAKRTTAVFDTPHHDPRPITSPREAIPVKNVNPQTSSTSSSARDEDWDVDFNVGELGE